MIALHALPASEVSMPGAVSKHGTGIPLSELSDEQTRSEILAALTLLIARGQAESAIRSIDKLLLAAGGYAGTHLQNQLRTLRALAEIEIGQPIRGCGPRNAINRETGSVKIMLLFVQEILPALQRVVATGGNQHLAHQVRLELLGAGQGRTTSGVVIEAAMSPREYEILRLVSSGMTNRAVADNLFITEGTVKKHLTNILTKLGASNRTQAVDHARRLGLL